MARNQPTDLANGLALYRAMYETLEAGQPLTEAQLAACLHDRVLGVLWNRIMDYAEFASRRRPLHRVACDDRSSAAIADHMHRWHQEAAARRAGIRIPPGTSCADAVRRAALDVPRRKHASHRKERA